MLLLLLILCAVGVGYAISSARVETPFMLVHSKTDMVLDAELESDD